MNALQISLIIILVFISAFMSGAEIALFSLSRFQMRHIRDRSRSTYLMIKRLLLDPGGLLITVLVVNEGVNIALSSILTQWAQERPGPSFLATWFPGLPSWAASSIIGTLYTAPVVLVFCEVTPKVIAVRANRVIAPLCVGTLSLLYGFFKPLRIVLMKILKSISTSLNANDAQAIDASTHRPMREDEFLVMIEEGHREGAIHPNEMGLIRNVFELDDTPVSEIFTPFEEAFTLRADTLITQVMPKLSSNSYSRIPLTKPESPQKIVGILYRKDLSLAQLQEYDSQARVDAICDKPLVVPQTIRTNLLFRRMKQFRTHIAIVEDADERAIGIVTMTDVLDAIFEDIFVEPDELANK